jgi:hypothetical protein
MGPRPPGRLRRPTVMCPIPRERADAVVAQSAARHLTPALPTSSPPPLHAPRMQLPPPCVCHAFILYVAATLRRSSFPFPLRSPLLFCCHASSPSPLFPDHPVVVRTGNQTPTFPSPRTTPLELTSWTSGPGASSSPATLPPLHRPSSIPPVASLEL